MKIAYLWRTVFVGLMFCFCLPVIADSVDPFPADEPGEHEVGFDRRKAEATARLVDGWSTFTLSLLNNDLPLVERYLAAGSNINERDRFGRTPLLIATQYDFTAMAKWLVFAGADVNTTGTMNMTPLDAARLNGNEALAQFLVDRGAISLETPRNQQKKEASAHLQSIVPPSKANPSAADAVSSASLPISVFDVPNFRIIPTNRVVDFGYEIVTVTDYHLEIDGFSQRVRLTSTQPGSMRSKAAEAKLSWLVPGVLLHITWEYIIAGTGSIRPENHLLVWVNGTELKDVFLAQAPLHHRNGGMGKTLGAIDLRWDDSQQQLTVAVEFRSGYGELNSSLLATPSDPYSTAQQLFFDYRHTKMFWRYRWTGQEFVFLSGEQRLLGMNGRPLIDIAQAYETTVPVLAEMNPALEDAVFCDRTVIVNDHLTEDTRYTNVNRQHLGIRLE